MASDVPYFTEHETRALIYIRQANQENPKEAPLTISEHRQATGWESKYYTRAHQKLEPRNLVNVINDGKYTRLELTETGRKTADKLMELNEILSHG